MELRNKVVWVTGSGRGIGAATAKAAAVCGARVVVSARSEEEIAATAAEINAQGDSAIAVRCDVRDEQQIQELVRQTRELWGDIDVLVNNAGRAHFRKIMDTTIEEWDEMAEVNMRGAFLCTRAVLPAMIEKGRGHIVNVISVAALQPYPKSGGYCASKYGLLGFTEVLRLETRKFGIKVTAVLPGATVTDIWGARSLEAERMMSPEDTARVIIDVLQSDERSMIETVVLRPQLGDL